MIKLRKYRETDNILVDDEDVERLNSILRPTAFWVIGSRGYVVGWHKDWQMQVTLGRMVLNTTDSSIYVDHINHNKLDNRKVNLRLCTNTQNQFNSTKIKGAVPFKGVFYRKDRNKYTSRIRIGGERLHLGMFDTAEEAYQAYKEAALKYHKEFACI